MSITIGLMGGLGNQLFQLFTLISYSIESKKPFYIEDKPITCGDRKKYYWNTRLLQNLKEFIQPPLENNMLCQEPFFHYEAIPRLIDPSMKIHAKLEGYFQSYKYFEKHKNIILRMIQLKQTQHYVKEKVAPYLPTNTFEQVVSLHFRVGDYVKLQDYHPLISVKYYEKALEQFLIDTDMIIKKKMFILYFCEENDLAYVNEKINYLKQNAKFQSLTFIKVPSHLDDWEQMILMSLCQHHIIANSTFSWWGAYLRERDHGLVYYPSTWFGPAIVDKKMDDLFLDGWKKIMC